MTPPAPVRLSDLESSLKQAQAITTLMEEMAHAIERDDCMGTAELLSATLTLQRDLVRQREDYIMRVRGGATTVIASAFSCAVAGLAVVPRLAAVLA